MSESSIKFPHDPSQKDVSVARALALVEPGDRIVIHAVGCPFTRTGICLCDPKTTTPMARC